MTKIFAGVVDLIKIIFSDMDGTLLTSENKLPEGFDEMIAELKKRGVIFAPASGRQYFSLLDTFNKYGDEFIFIADGGTIVFYHGKELFSQPMDKKIALEVIHAGDNMDDILRVYCGKHDAYVLDFQDTPAYRAELLKYYSHSVAVKKWEDVDEVPIKMSFFDGTGNADKNIFQDFLRFSDKTQVLLSSDYWVDIMMPNVDKGSAVRKIQQMLDIKPEECAAFGDFLNDYEMFKSVGYSFAMANAHPDLKKVAKFETVSNDEYGVLVGIQRLMDENLLG